jgi:CheY-like chemotaxis protein
MNHFSPPSASAWAAASGLSMAYGFVKQSGGGLSIQSQPGQGTTVLMVLPLTTAEPEQDQPSEDAALPTAANWCCWSKMMPNVRRVVRQQLIDLGYPVIEAENGAQALEMIEQIPISPLSSAMSSCPAAINGRQLAEQTLLHHPRMRIVLMSGYADEVDEEGASALPF